MKNLLLLIILAILNLSNTYGLEVIMLVNGKQTSSKELKEGDNVALTFNATLGSSTSELNYKINSYEVEGTAVGNTYSFTVGQEQRASGSIVIYARVNNGDGISTEKNSTSDFETDDFESVKFTVNQNADRLKLLAPIVKVNGQIDVSKNLKLGDQVEVIFVTNLLDNTQRADFAQLNYQINSYEVEGSIAGNTFSFTVGEEQRASGSIDIYARVNNGDGISTEKNSSRGYETDDLERVNFTVEQNSDRLSLLAPIIKVNGKLTDSKKVKKGDKVEVTLVTNLIDNTQKADFMELNYQIESYEVEGTTAGNTYSFTVGEEQRAGGSIDIYARVNNGDGISTENHSSRGYETDDFMAIKLEVDQSLAEKVELINTIGIIFRNPENNVNDSSRRGKSEIAINESTRPNSSSNNTIKR